MFPEKNTEKTKKNLSMLVQQMSVNVFFGMNAKEQKAFFGFFFAHEFMKLEFNLTCSARPY